MSDDILRVIVRKLRFYAYHRKFAATCLDWYNITKEKHGAFQANSIFLLLPFDHETETCALYQISDSTIVEFSLPELKDKFVHGSSNGWLALADNNFRLSLINPLTCAQIRLPDSSYSVASLERCDRDMHDPFFRSFLMSKFVVSENAVLSSTGNCLVAAIMSTTNELFVCRLGDDSWTPITLSGWHFVFTNKVDMIFFNGKLYATEIGSHIVEVEFDGTDFKPHCVGGPKMSTLEFPLHRAKGYLVKCSEDLLLVYKIVEHSTDETTPYKTVDFEVYKFEANAITWTMIHELGEHSLFLGRNESIAVSLQDLPAGYKTNCIYFADDYNDGQGENQVGYQFDNGIFSLADGSMEMLNISHSMTHWVCTPLWYQPRLDI